MSVSRYLWSDKRGSWLHDRPIVLCGSSQNVRSQSGLLVCSTHSCGSLSVPRILNQISVHHRRQAVQMLGWTAMCPLRLLEPPRAQAAAARGADRRARGRACGRSAGAERGAPPCTGDGSRLVWKCWREIPMRPAPHADRRGLPRLLEQACRKQPSRFANIFRRPEKLNE